MRMNRLLVAAAGLLTAASVVLPSPTRAGPLDWIRIRGVCYDYDPYDKFHLYGKYYPYSGEECRDRRLTRKHKSKAHIARRAKGESCTRSNIKNQRNACPG
jgi:hypothetical protein